MKIAIVGGGVSGLAAARLLHEQHDITLYESADYLGGHSRTVDVHTPDGNQVAVDTGFIVFNHRNYPHLTAMFQWLGVETAPSNMSFGVSVNDGWLEYGTENLGGLFAQKRNLLRGRFWRMLRDTLHFFRHARDVDPQNTEMTLGECLDRLGVQDWFRQYYLLAMGGAIWSMPVAQMLQFPARTLIQFFDNHGLLSVTQQPQWYTPKGGSRVYVEKLCAPFAEKVRLGCAVKQLVRTASGVEIHDSQGGVAQCDQVILACHSDQALAMIAEPSHAEDEILSAIRYQPNRVVLHSDTRLMPKRRKAWASWVYLSAQCLDANPKVSLSYWMNNLQPLGTEYPIMATLNPQQEIAAEKIHDTHEFAHPVFDQPAIAAQGRIGEIQGVDRLWFCGAWQTYGFHEDGLQSAVRVAKEFGVLIPWTL